VVTIPLNVFQYGPEIRARSNVLNYNVGFCYLSVQYALGTKVSSARQAPDSG
jgi:hypothetical protein